MVVWLTYQSKANLFIIEKTQKLEKCLLEVCMGIENSMFHSGSSGIEIQIQCHFQFQ